MGSGPDPHFSVESLATRDYLLCVTKRWFKKALCCLNPALLSNSLNCRRTDSASGPVPSQRHCCLPSSCTLRRPDPIRLPPRPGRNLISISDPTSEPAACSIKNIQVSFPCSTCFRVLRTLNKPKVTCHELDTCQSHIASLVRTCPDVHALDVQSRRLGTRLA